MDWQQEGIRIWFFPRMAVPVDIRNGNPISSGWEKVYSITPPYFMVADGGFAS
jgi:hypothetical protein